MVKQKKYINPVVIYLERCLATQLYPCLFHCTYISATLNIERKSKVYMRSRQHGKSYECLIYVACPLEKKKKSAKSLVWDCGDSLSQMFFKIGILKNFANFTGKHMCWSLFLIKLLVLRPATLLTKDSNAGALLYH